MLTNARIKRMLRGNLTAADVARAIDTNVNSYYSWERGREYYYLTAEEVRRLAELLNVAPEDIADARGHATVYSVA